MYLYEKIKKHHVFLIFVGIRKLLAMGRIVYFLKDNPGMARKKYIGKCPRIFGLRNIRLPEAYSFGDHTWLEAVSLYRGDEYISCIEIGNNFSASDFFHIGCSNKIFIGENVLIGSKVHITDHAHGIYHGESQSSPGTAPAERRLTKDGFVKIGDNVWIGDGVVILPNVSIGNGSIIGANSVISKSIPENVIAVGIPAKVIKKWDKAAAKWIRV